MKKVALLLTGLALSLVTSAQSTDTCCHSKKHSSFTKGRTPYIYVGPETSLPIFDRSNMRSATYGYSAELGLWGTEKLTTFGLVADFVKQHDTISVNKSLWLGVKGYLTVWQNTNSVYMIYGAPKMLVSKFAGGPNALLEVGINPCYTINKHMLFSFTVCDQIMDMNNNFSKSIWNPGISVGLVIYK
jgi:hypothetical protein